MNPIQGYESAPAYTGEVMQLPPGLYVCIVKQVNLQQVNGKEQMVLLFDIAEGDQKGFYQRQFESRRQGNSDAKWGGVYRQFTHDKGLPYFKGIICSIEKSNNGYRWDWNEKGLVGKKFGGIFGREEFLARDGEKRMATKIFWIRSVEGLKDAKIPEDRLLQEKPAGAGDYGVPGPDSDGFMNIPDGIDEELPFM